MTIDNDLLDRFEPDELRPPQLTPIYRDDFDNRGGPPLSSPSSTSIMTFPPRAPDPPKREPTTPARETIVDRLLRESLAIAQGSATADETTAASEVTWAETIENEPPPVEERRGNDPTTTFGIIAVIVWAIWARQRRVKRRRKRE